MFLWLSTVIVFVFCIYKIKISDYCGPDSLHPLKVNGSSTDNVSTLLNRLDYGNNISIKMNHYKWLIIRSIILSFFVSLLLLNKLPSSKRFLSCAFIIFILLNAFRNYSDHHENRFINYFMDKDIQLIRKKLNIKNIKNKKRGEKLSSNPAKESKKFYYIYKDLE